MAVRLTNVARVPGRVEAVLERPRTCALRLEVEFVKGCISIYYPKKRLEFLRKSCPLGCAVQAKGFLVQQDRGGSVSCSVRGWKPERHLHVVRTDVLDAPSVTLVGRVASLVSKHLFELDVQDTLAHSRRFLLGLNTASVRLFAARVSVGEWIKLNAALTGTHKWPWDGVPRTVSFDRVEEAP